MESRKAAFLNELEQRILVFDGAMGTSTHALSLTLDDYAGCENCPEILNDTRPEAVEQIHRSFLEAGCDVIETNTFGGSQLTLSEFGLEQRTRELNRKAAQIARRAADAFSTPDRPRFVAGSIGPGTKLVTLRQTDYDTMLASYAEQVRGLLEGGVDLLIIETCQDILQCKCAIFAAISAMREAGVELPLIVQVTMETTGTMLVGTDIAAAIAAIEAYPEVDVIGLNCATGPQEMSEHVRHLATYCSRRLSVLPNAGLPQVVDGAAHFPLQPDELARWLREFVEVDGVNVVGGCCGTTPAHIAAVVEAVRGLKPKPRQITHEPATSSLYQAMPHRQDNSFLIVGERCNTNGSRQFKRLLSEGDLDGLVAMGVSQVRDEGAHVLDVCVDYVGRDGVPDMQKVVDRFAREVTVPLMLDSTEPPVVEAGLKLSGGKCIINSVNLEDGEGKLARVAGLARQYGAAVVALTIDEDPVEAMGKTADRKLAIAERLHDLLTRKYGLAEEDIFFDCLTFPITTGNQADRRLGLETLDGIERIMQRFPRCQSILGLSNISFGLVPAARVVLNSVYLHEARQRGLTAAIVHAGKILPRNQISDERWQAALDLIYDRHDHGNPLERFIALFDADEKVGDKAAIESLPVEQRLQQRIIDGNRTGLGADLDEAMQRYQPLQIINEFLLAGMKVVGDLFGSGQMQLPFVLKSAETMKAAVAHLEPHMERVEGQSRGRLVLATVRGDVHDIGKNLVDILVSNNGYTVYNLGIKQPIQNVIDAWSRQKADVIGLSGLLVKSTLVMRDDLAVLNEHGITAPVILGGAALTRRYVEQDLRQVYKGPLYYAKDAFEGLDLMKTLTEGGQAATPGNAATTPSDVAGAARADATVAPADATTARASRAGAPGDATTAGAHAAAAPRGGRRTPGDPDSPEIQPVRSESEARQRNLDKLAEEAQQRFGVKPIDDDETPAGAPPAEPPAEQTAASQGRDDADGPAPAVHVARPARARRPIGITHEHPVPTPPFWGTRVLEHIPIRAALGFMNETMLFQVQWGFRKRGRSPEQWKRYLNTEVRPHYRDLVARCEQGAILEPKAIYGFWPCHSDGDDLIIYAPEGTGNGPQKGDRGSGIGDRLETGSRKQGTGNREQGTGNREQGTGDRGPKTENQKPKTENQKPKTELGRFTFPRQKKSPYWCLSDFFRPIDSGETDVVAFHIVTAGQRVSQVAREWFARNEYQQYLFLHGLGVETAEALAEYVHKQARADLGVGQHDARDLQALFKQGYQGSRYSFGYPACPNLEDQVKLIELLGADRIGVTLSEGYQLDPEQSTSAIITVHPQARYFNVR